MVRNENEAVVAVVSLKNDGLRLEDVGVVRERADTEDEDARRDGRAGRGLPRGDACGERGEEVVWKNREDVGEGGRLASLSVSVSDRLLVR